MLPDRVMASPVVLVVEEGDTTVVAEEEDMITEEEVDMVEEEEVDTTRVVEEAEAGKEAQGMHV